MRKEIAEEVTCAIGGLDGARLMAETNPATNGLPRHDNFPASQLPSHRGKRRNCQWTDAALNWHRVKNKRFSQVIAQGIEFQARLPSLALVAVGGTAAAIHCGHRISFDVDCVSPHLSERFDQVAETLENWPGWKTNRQQKPLIILGERQEVELGIRQLRRAVPLQITQVRALRVPTPREALRIKAFLCVERRAVRDFVDVAALSHLLGEEAALAALKYLNLLYPSATGQTRITRFAEVCEMEPLDLATVRLSDYKGLQAPWNQWPAVQAQSQRLARRLLQLELNRQLPSALDDGFYEPAPSR